MDTGHLHYWSESTNHAVVAVGLGEEGILLYDPAFDDPQAVRIREFELAWMVYDHYCATIAPPLEIKPQRHDLPPAHRQRHGVGITGQFRALLLRQIDPQRSPERPP